MRSWAVPTPEVAVEEAAAARVVAVEPVGRQAEEPVRLLLRREDRVGGERGVGRTVPVVAGRGGG